MRHPLFLAAVGSAMVAGLVSVSASAGTKHAQSVPVACEKQKDTAPKPVSHNDLTQNGLVFDQAAPGGARPEDQSEGQQTAVDPTTVTLFPSASSTSTPSKAGKKDDHAQDDCP
jgi:hypothetical protein